eukprot:14200489-Ditylum_brightwellii.AAC.1
MELFLCAHFAHLLHNYGFMQWWIEIPFFTITYKMIAWKDHILPLVSFRWVVIKEEMDIELFKHHVTYFSQTEGMPFTQPPSTDMRLFTEADMGKSF